MAKNNRESNYRYHWFEVDYCGDGMFKKPRIKGKDKRFLRKLSQRRIRKNELKSEFNT